ncbi:hypothetical protein CLOM_g17591 [Closterium sp. NIES-68]|nr:hypothetical protein CLOM_g17591 [Closterium sp. NIES-68]GJP62845.1 hypothetical protein CLOP_g19862 [Closterium sp. NIES-67]GJP67535.1 hypothetical protein CLOP_g24346 [Closterium sp. NIES-67]
MESLNILAPRYTPSTYFSASHVVTTNSSFHSCRFASTSVHSTFSASPAASPAASAAGSAAAAKPREASGAESLLASLGLKPLPLFPGSPLLENQSAESSESQSAWEGAEGDGNAAGKGVKRRRKQNLADILWRRPAWGQGARVAKRHWQEGTFYEVSRVQIAKTGRTATVWGIFHQQGVPVAAEARIGGANKPCWKAVREGEEEEEGDGGEEEEGRPAVEAQAVPASV